MNFYVEITSKGAMPCAKLKQLTQSIARGSYHEGFQWIRIPFTIQLSLSRRVIIVQVLPVFHNLSDRDKWFEIHVFFVCHLVL
jgi:hypothetical protein